MDVTAVKQMRQRLEEHEQRYRRLTDAVTDYIYHVRAQRGRAVQTVHGANCEALTGHAPEEFDANPMLWIAMVPTEDRAAVELQAARILSGKDAPNIEHRIQRKDGQIRWVLSTVSPQHDDQGHLIAYDGLLRDITERKRAEEALRSNQQLLKTIYDTEPECVNLMNADGTLTMMNCAGLKMIEADSVDEVQGESVYSLVVPADRDAFRSLTQRVFRGESGSLEFDIVGRRGTHRTLETHAVPLRDSSGDITSLLAITRDITERKRADQALGESERRYRSLVTASAATVWTTDPDGGFSSPQPSWEVHTGQPWEEHRGWGWSKMIHPDDNERIGRTWREALDEPRIFCTEGRVWHAASCEYHYVEVRAVPIFNDDGIVLEWVGTTTDIHGRKLAEESLRRAHELSESMIDTAQNIVLVLDTDGHIVRFNAYMEELSGWKIDEVRGRDWFDTFVPEHDRQPMQELFARALGGERTRGNVNPIVTKSGHDREIEWYDASLTDADGELVGLLCTGQDVTERRMLQREILEIAADEQRRIGQELHDGTQQQLTGLSLLAQNVATSLDKLCQADEESGFLREAGFFDRITATQQRATQVQNGLKHAACEVNQLARGLIPVELDAQGLMSSLTELARSVNEVQQIACTFTNDAPIEVGNNFTATHLYRIAQETVNNALKHSRGERIEISLSERNGVITLKVFDNGNGIDKKRENGLGMGLRIMSYRAELIGAALSIGQAKGGGTEMTCTVTQS